MDWDRFKATWPNAQHSKFVRSHPHTWHVQSKGEGAPILLLHGAGASTHTWAPIFDSLSQKHTVIAIDLPGQGFTKFGDRTRCGLEPMSEDIAKLLEALDIRPAIVIGHSAGAAIALDLTTRLEPQPNVILINGALENFRGVAGVLFPMFAKALSLNPTTGYLFSMFSANESRVAKLIGSTGSQLSGEQIALYTKLVSDGGHVNATLMMMAQWSLDTLPETLAKIRSQVHFLIGAKDTAVPPDASRAAARQLANAQVTEFEDLGHVMHEEAPDRIAKSILSIISKFPTKAVNPAS